ncbi:MAG: Uma2 family endonuclease [Candidatus Sericytochromatia bacterium]|nr:Uma2 family endonuclease [Candidatus Sericytochromatia bacterium]
MNTTLEIKEYTYNDYLKTDDEKRYELIGGNLIMVPAPNTEHQNVSKIIEMSLYNFVLKNKLGDVYNAPIDVYFDDKNLVQPDILFIAQDNMSIIKKKGIFGSPDVLVEIISPSSRNRDLYTKKDLYQLFKIKEYWIVDPINKSVDILKLGDDGVYKVHSSSSLNDEEQEDKNVYSGVVQGFSINLTEIFNRTFD